MKSKLVTIITVCYNAENCIQETIKSVISQIDIDFEYIIIDGLSTDKTINIINKYQNSIDLIISEPDNGIYDAMNKGIVNAKGDWVIFMNAGDKFYTNNILYKIFCNKTYDNLIVLYGNTSYYKNDKVKIIKTKSLKRIWKGMPICHQSMFVKTSYLKNNHFDVKYSFASDYNLLYKIYKSNKLSLKNLNTTISIISTNGISETNSILTYREYMKIGIDYNKSKLIQFYYVIIILERAIVVSLKKLLNFK